jgi:hypothetical protein
VAEGGIKSKLKPPSERRPCLGLEVTSARPPAPHLGRGGTRDAHFNAERGNKFEINRPRLDDAAMGSIITE